MSSTQNIQWFPGHMTKAIREIKENLKLVDLVAEIIDARIPVSSRNPNLDEIINKKPRVIVMNKSDMADSSETKKWIDHYRGKGIMAMYVDCRTGDGVNKFSKVIKDSLSQKISLWKEKGMTGRCVKVMVVGVPNVGKSTFINRLTSKSKAKTADRPGVTKGNQWFSLDKGIDLLDTPGVLWPKFDDPLVGERLAFTGAVRDQVLDIESLAVRLIDTLVPKYVHNLSERFKIDVDVILKLDSYECLKLIAKKRGMIMSGAELDIERAAIMLIDEFRDAKLGRITLERFI